MVRARNLITNNLSNAYAVGAVSLRGETYVESGIPARLPYVYTVRRIRRNTRQNIEKR